MGSTCEKLRAGRRRPWQMGLVLVRPGLIISSSTFDMSDNVPPPKRRTWLIPTYIAGGLLIADFFVEGMGKGSVYEGVRPFLLGAGIVALVVAGIMSRRKS